MKKIFITVVYILFFWAILPFLLLSSSFFLDRKKELGFQGSAAKLFTGAAVAVFSFVMLLLSVFQFSKGACKLPISALPPYDKLVSTGVYALWRHPIYLFYTTLFGGIGLAAGSGGMIFVILPLFALVVVIHALIEEFFLLRKHGEVYRQYQRSTGLLIPKRKKSSDQ
ncbi:hypothetical protein CHISP_3080 [Chitinispirillum alkaliphilum]|nr:hypothetical protein CHISP_3080 [Chitinispirillum alkaliphilum]